MHVHKHTMYVLQISFNLTSDSLEILIIQHLGRIVPRFEVSFVTRKTSFSIETGNFRDMFKKAYKSICTPTVVAHPDTLSPTPTTSSVMKTPENGEQNPDDPEPAGEGDIQMEYYSD